MLLIFTFCLEGEAGRPRKALFVRWFKPASIQPPREFLAAVEATRLPRLQWEMVPAPRGVGSKRRPAARGRREAVPRCDVIPAGKVIEPVYLQVDPSQEGCFFFNHHVRCGGA